MLSNLWRLLKSIVVVAGLLLSFFAIIELIRVYQTLSELHRIAGYIYLTVLGLIIFCIFIYYYAAVRSRPVVLNPPQIVDPDAPSKRELLSYGKYLVKYISRFSKNEILTDGEKEMAKVGADMLTVDLKKSNNPYAIISVIEKAEREIVIPLLERLNQQAEKEVRNSTRDVMIAVAFSPYQAVDLLVVVYRNIAMVTRIIRIYNSRPRLREQLRILADTINVVVTVNYLNLGSHLLRDLGSKVPVIGKSLDNIAQGVGAGLMTSVSGHAALYRCRAFKEWSSEDAQLNVLSHLNQFYADVRGIFFVDILPGVRKSLGDITAVKWEKIQNGIGVAIDETGKVLDNFVKRPISSAKSGVISAGKTGGKAVFEAGRFTIKTFQGAFKTVFNESKSVVSKVWAPLKAKLKRRNDKNL